MPPLLLKLLKKKKRPGQLPQSSVMEDSSSSSSNSNSNSNSSNIAS